MSNEIAVQFDQDSIRRVENEGTTYYSLVDIVATFTGTNSARQYWLDTKKRLKRDGFQLSETIVQLKLKSSDGKRYMTDVADARTCLRIVQSIPSANAEPVRQWLAQLGVERIEEAGNPELGITRAVDRSRQRYVDEGKSEAWIEARFNGIVARKMFTDALRSVVFGIESQHYSLATNEVYLSLWNRTATQLKVELGLTDKQSLRDNQHHLALGYQQIAESAIAHKLGDGDTITWHQAVQAIRVIAGLVGTQAHQMGNLLGMDVATGKPLLGGGEHG